MTIPALVGALQQADQHLERARAMLAAALTELGKAEALIEQALGSSSGSTVALTSRSRQDLTHAGQAMTETTRELDEWIARVDPARVTLGKP